MNITLNKYQTPITDDLLESLPQEVQDQLLDCINNIEFIKNLTSVSRQHAKDRPKDSDGKIIIDLTNPHILENMDYFRPSAIHYKDYKCFTSLKPNSNPNSEYGKWIREERDRCWNGYVRKSDGEWITGALYFYINYCPIVQSRIVKGTKRANRVVDFPELWEGIYWRFHYINYARLAGQHGAELAARGKSKSYSMASIITRNFILGENNEACTNTVSVVTASQKEYLIKDGVLNKFITMANFCAENTQFPRKRIKNSLQDMTWVMGYKDVDLDIERGTLNSVLGVSSKDDESKIRGKRAVFIGVEEFGTFPRLIDLYNTMLPSVQEGDYTFGVLYLQGTAGDKESDFSGAREIMYNPKGYNMYSLPNVYDKNNQGRKLFVFFFPGYINRKGCYNKDGVSDVTKALIEILTNRYKVKYNSTDPNTIVKTIAELPITPAEAILRTGVNLFPVTDLTERLNQLDSNPNEYSDVYTGNLIITKNSTIEFRPTTDSPIREFPHKDNKVSGSIEIFNMPEINKATSKVYSNRYIASSDPYDDDQSNTMSLGSTFVFDLWTDKIVAEYTGRPLFADDYYEITRRLCLFYDARMNYENNKKGLFAYFSKMNSTYLLTDTLEYLKDKDIIKGSFYGNKAKGTNANLPINNYGKKLLKFWLLKPTTVIQNMDGKDTEVTIPSLYTIRNRALLKELILYNSIGNFDRVSSMGMLMLLREDKLVLYGGDSDKIKNSETTSDYLGNDKFFTNNFDNKFTNNN